MRRRIALGSHEIQTLAPVVLLALSACVPTYRETVVTPETVGRVLLVTGEPAVGAALYFEAAPGRGVRTDASGGYRLSETRRRGLDLVLPVTGAVMADHALVVEADGYGPVRVRVRAPSWGGAAVDLPPVVLSASDAFPETGAGFAAPADLAAPADCSREAWENAADLWRVARQAAVGARSERREAVGGRLIVESAYHHAQAAWGAVQPTCERRFPYAGWTRAGDLEGYLAEEAGWALEAEFPHE